MNNTNAAAGRKRSVLMIALLAFVMLISACGILSQPQAEEEKGNTETNSQKDDSADQAPPKTNPAVEEEKPAASDTNVEEQKPEAPDTTVYDTVISGGRVMDPETGYDGVADVGIRNGSVAKISKSALKGKQTIEAKGLVVAPGFIDNLSYNPNSLGVWNKIGDGVTSNIAMHGGSSNPKAWYAHYEDEHPPVHFGASFFYSEARNQFKLSRYQTASKDQVAKLVAQAEKALNNGSLGISFSLEYVPGVNRDEIVPMMKLAYQYNVPVFFHARYSDMEEPGTNFDALNEIIGYAEETGASVHIDHINSTGGTFSMVESLKMVDKARAKGLDITACTYPYDYWGTYLNSARFDKGWQDRFHISYGDLQLAGTSERLTQSSFSKYQKQGKLAVAYAIPPEDVVNAFKAPYVMIGSDAILEPGFNNHPRASGTFARTLGLYARQYKVMSLMDAIGKLSLLPAQRLEKQVPALKKKGRLSPGADADIVIFNDKTVIDKSTVEKPQLMSEGIEYVLVAGEVVKTPQGMNKKARLGKGIKSEFTRAQKSGKTLVWGKQSIPLINYNGSSFFDLEWLSAMGFDVKRDNVKKEVAVSDSGSGSSKTPPAISYSSLVLERGYVAKTPGKSFDLLSIEDRLYIPIRSLYELGEEYDSSGNTVTVKSS